MIHCTLSCVRFISILYDSMASNYWNGFDKWMCFRCGKTFSLRKYVSYCRNNLLLVFSDCPHPACSVCEDCYSWWIGATLATDFQQFNTLRISHNLVPLTDDVLMAFTDVSDMKSNKCYLFDLLICFAKAKLFRHILDIDGALKCLTVSVYCSLEKLYDKVGDWSRDDFIDFARQLDGATTPNEMLEVIIRILKSFAS